MVIPRKNANVNANNFQADKIRGRELTSEVASYRILVAYARNITTVERRID